jgi:ABC-type phosphate transport system auxiliary subunit
MSKLNKEQVKAIADAIATIEEHGGFVIFDDKITLAVEQHHVQIKNKMDKDKVDAAKAHAKQLKEAYNSLNNELDHQVSCGIFDFNAFEDILFDEGLEPDYLEDWINSHF